MTTEQYQTLMEINTFHIRCNTMHDDIVKNVPITIPYDMLLRSDSELESNCWYIVKG